MCLTMWERYKDRNFVMRNSKFHELLQILGLSTVWAHRQSILRIPREVLTKIGFTSNISPFNYIRDRDLSTSDEAERWNVRCQIDKASYFLSLWRGSRYWAGQLTSNRNSFLPNCWRESRRGQWCSRRLTVWLHAGQGVSREQLRSTSDHRKREGGRQREWFSQPRVHSADKKHNSAKLEFIKGFYRHLDWAVILKDERQRGHRVILNRAEFD